MLSALQLCVTPSLRRSNSALCIMADTSSTSHWTEAGVVENYHTARPTHPASLVETVLSFLGQEADRNLALDVGCGSGMRWGIRHNIAQVTSVFSTVNLAGKFTRVLGLDVSPAMVAAAARAVAGAEFKVSPAETLPVLSNTAQLVIVGRAIHYFDHKQFFKEVGNSS